MLEHLSQSRLLENAAAILVGDFIDGNEPNGESKIPSVLERFAANATIPVLSIPHIGHAAMNFPIAFGTPATLQCGNQPVLTIKR